MPWWTSIVVHKKVDKNMLNSPTADASGFCNSSNISGKQEKMLNILVCSLRKPARLIVSI